MSTGAPHLGIDLGTLRLAATVVRAGVAETVDIDGTGAASSAVAIVGDRLVTAAEAERVLADHPDHGVRELMRRFGDTTPVVLDGRPFTADALAAEQMRAVAAAAGIDPGACNLTLTHPASWHDYKCDLLARTANLCGFSEVQLLAAPVAVAGAYVAAGHLHAGDTVAVFDLGGTLEASIVRIGEDAPTVVGTPQLLERFGGDVIDQMVFRHVASALGGALEAMDRNDPAVRSSVMRLRAECAAAKERLSTDSEASVTVQAPGLDTVVRITRDEFEATLRPPMGEALNALERAMASAGVTASDLTGVLLVGGGARIPVVGEMVAGHLGRRAIADLDPSMAVALGATAAALLLAAPAAAAEPAETSAPESAAGNAAEAPSAPTDKETNMSDKPNSEATPAGAPGNIPAPPPPPAKKGVGGKAAGVAAGVAAAAAAVAGAVIYGDDVVEALTGDDGTTDAAAAEALTADQAERIAEGDDPSMDAFDDVAPQGAAQGVPLDAPSGAPAGGGQSAAPAAAQSESAGGFDRGPAPAAEPVVDSEPPAPAAPPAPESVPPPSTDPAFEDARASLLAALDDFEAPAGATPEEVEELKQNLREAIERFDPESGQSTEDALAELRDEYDSIVTDFVQDQKIDALVGAQQAEEAEGEAEGAATDGATPEGEVPGEAIPGDAEPGLDLPNIDLPNIDLPGVDLPDMEIKPMPMPVVDPDDFAISPETPEQGGGADGPFLNPDLIDLIDGPAVPEPGLQIDLDVLAGKDPEGGKDPKDPKGPKDLFDGADDLGEGIVGSSGLGADVLGVDLLAGKDPEGGKDPKDPKGPKDLFDGADDLGEGIVGSSGLGADVLGVDLLAGKDPEGGKDPKDPKGPKDLFDGADDLGEGIVGSSGLGADVLGVDLLAGKDPEGGKDPKDPKGPKDLFDGADDLGEGIVGSSGLGADVLGVDLLAGKDPEGGKDPKDPKGPKDLFDGDGGDGGGVFGGLSDAFDDLLADQVDVNVGPGQGFGGGAGQGGKGLVDAFADTVGDLVGDQGGLGGAGQGLMDSLGDTVGGLLGDDNPLAGKDPEGGKDPKDPKGPKDLFDGADDLAGGIKTPEFADDAFGDSLLGLDDNLGNSLADLGNVSSDLADDITSNLPTNLEFGFDGI